MHNTRTGVTTRFVRTAHDTNGKLLEMEVTYSPHSTEPVSHYHPCQSEDFVVLAGSLCVRMNGYVRTLVKGDSLHIPPNTVHAMWNDTAEDTRVNWKVQPALDTEYFLETVTGLANDNKTDKAGTPSLLQTAMLAWRFSPVFRLQRPPYVVQWLVLSLLAPIARMCGYRSVYSKYVN